MNVYVKYVLFVILELIASVFNYIAAPFVVLFADKDGFLPRWLWWFQTPDNTLDGDSGWKNEHRRFKIEDSPWKRWYNRTTWLYRNSMYGFCIDVIGCKTRGTDTLLTYGDIKTSNRPVHSGYLHYELWRDEKLIAFQYYIVSRYSTNRCIRINIGYKLWDFRKGEDINCQLTFSPNPLMGISDD